MTLPWLLLPGETSDGEPAITRAHRFEGGPGLLWLAHAVGKDDEDKGPEGTTTFVASKATVNRYSDVVDQQSWILGPFKANPVILYEHEVPVVGHSVKTWRATKGDDGRYTELRAAVKWDAVDLNPVGQLVAHQHQQGIRNAVSVRFMPGEVTNRRDLKPDHPLHVHDDVERWQAGYLMTNCELMEISSVAVPACREALQLRAFVAEREGVDDQVRRHLHEVTPKSVRENVLAAIRNDAEIRKAVLALVLGAPESSPSAGRLPWLREVPS